MGISSRWLKGLALLCAMFLLANVSCDEAASGPDPRVAVIAELGEAFAQVRYDAFEARTAEMSAAVGALCTAASRSSADREQLLAAARAAWTASHKPWKETELIRFGPTIEYPLRLGPKLDDWPVDPTAVDGLVASGDPVGAADFATKGTSTRGLPVVEYLLWVGEGPLAGLDDPRRCGTLVGAAADVAANAVLLAESWRTEWRDRLAEPTGNTDDMYDSLQDVVAEWVNRLGFTVENIRDTKLGTPIGDKAGGKPQPGTVESAYSGRSLADAMDVLTGVGEVWARFKDFVPSAIATKTDELFESARAALGAVRNPLLSYLDDVDGSIRAAQTALQALQVAFQVDVSQALGVTVAFNDNDGD